jgi:copper transporter 1
MDAADRRMLFGMYFNGYILFAIFLGQTVGYLLFGKDLASGDKEGTGSGHCC